MAKSKEQFNTLRVAPPKAQLIADGYKDVENRAKNCKIRGYVALYSWCSRALWRFEYAEEMGRAYDPDEIDYGPFLVL